MGKKDKNLHYKNKSIRLSENTWERLQDERGKSGKTWNMFMVLLLKLRQKNKKND